MKIINLLFCMPPVSYTHLDVYKRQVLTHLSHDMDYGILSGKLPENVMPAYDGLRPVSYTHLFRSRRAGNRPSAAAAECQ